MRANVEITMAAEPENSGTLKTLLGVALMVLGALGCVGMFTGAKTIHDSGAVGGLIILASMIVGGAALIKSSWQKALPKETAAALEQRVLEAARRRLGLITVSELALDLDTSVAVAQIELDRMVNSSVADLEVGATGMMIYTFKSFIREAGETEEAKRRAANKVTT